MKQSNEAVTFLLQHLSPLPVPPSNLAPPPPHLRLISPQPLLAKTRLTKAIDIKFAHKYIDLVPSLPVCPPSYPPYPSCSSPPPPPSTHQAPTARSSSRPARAPTRCLCRVCQEDCTATRCTAGPRAAVANGARDAYTSIYVKHTRRCCTCRTPLAYTIAY